MSTWRYQGIGGALGADGYLASTLSAELSAPSSATLSPWLPDSVSDVRHGEVEKRALAPPTHLVLFVLCRSVGSNDCRSSGAPANDVTDFNRAR